MYKYEDYRQQVLEDPDTYIRVKSIALSRIGANGVIRALDIMEATGKSDSWEQCAYVDRLVEMGVITEIKQVEDVFFRHKLYQ